MSTEISYKHYDFIEVGTSCFDTLTQLATTERGLAIEPIGPYLDALPSPVNVTKITAALVPYGKSENPTIDVYLVPPQDIRKHGLGQFLMGCNRVGRPHDLHLNYMDNPNEWNFAEDRSSLVTRNLLAEGIVEKMVVPCLTWANVFEQHGVRSIDQLKLDTEGMDAELILDLLQTTTIRPRFITFETVHHDEEVLESAIDMLRACYYSVHVTDLYNRIAVLDTYADKMFDGY